MKETKTDRQTLLMTKSKKKTCLAFYVEIIRTPVIERTEEEGGEKGGDAGTRHSLGVF